MSAPDQAPAGVQIQFLPRPPATGPYAAAWQSWLASNPGTVTESRQKITPRLILIHTNGASGTGSIASAYSWSMRDPNYTKPHYQVDMDGSAAKFLPSDRKGIGNGTVVTKTGGIRAADFSLVIETADPGYGAGKPGQAGGFTPAQVETVAQIIAYESALWNIPIEYPETWDSSGVACHTEPFGYPYWTIDAGHVCPGRQKKLDMVELVMPRARAILSPAPTPSPTPIPQPPLEDDMRVSVLQLTGCTPNAMFLGLADAAGHFWQVYWVDGSKPRELRMLDIQIQYGGAPVFKFDAGVAEGLQLLNPNVPSGAHDDGRPWAATDFGSTPNIV